MAESISTGLNINKAGFTKSSNKNFWKRVIKFKVVYFLMLPALITFLIFNYIPMAGIIMAFNEYKIGKGFTAMFTSPWVGFAQFKRMFGDFYFFSVLKNTIIINFYKLIFVFPAPIIFAILLNEIRNRFFKRFMQTVSYLPSFLSTVVVYGLALGILSPSYGLLNALLSQFGVKPVYFLVIPEFFRSIIVSLDIWRYTGWDAIIYLAGITAINTELYDAAIVDGASKFRQIWHITLPGISNLILLMFIFRIGSMLDAGFETIFLFYSPLVYSVGDIIDTYVYRVGIFNSSYSFATAVGLFKSVAGFALIMITNNIAKKYNKTGIW